MKRNLSPPITGQRSGKLSLETRVVARKEWSVRRKKWLNVMKGYL